MPDPNNSLYREYIHYKALDVASDSNKAILDKVANYLRNNLERYDHIGLTKEEFIEDLIKNVTK